VAGRLSEKYYRPALVITRTADGFKGSGRSIAEFNLMAALEETADYLDKFGGHPMACGFSVFDQEKLDKFVEKMKIIAKEKLVGLELKPKLSIDAELKMADINLGMLEQIEKLAPYGQANPQPKFVSYGVLVNEIVNMGANSQHVKIRLTDSENRTKSLWAIAFGKSEAYSHLQVGDIVDLVYYLEINNFNGRREGQMKIIDLIKK
jgi:single-stranded-DNA-specific exonuclease